MNRLVINTANDILTIVLDVGGNAFLKTSNAKMHHNEVMLPLIDELLKEHNLRIGDINEFGVVIGPGSFTGIRVGIATIKAFRDALAVKAKGINNLRLLYNLAKSQNENIKTVAIAGSRDSYFVASMINDTFYIFERNLTLNELKQVADGSQVAMFANDENLNPFVVTMDKNIVIRTLNESDDEDLIPVYYQLSQAESEKLKRGNVVIAMADNCDIDAIEAIEQSSINVNALYHDDVVTGLNNYNYTTIKAVFNDEIVGFIMLQFTDEANVVSIAVKKDYRNLGIATRLFDVAYDEMREKGIDTISLEVKYDNITAYNLYKKLGFEVRRIRKAYYADGQDCLEMVKTI